MANKHRKRCRTSRVIGVLQIKTTCVVLQIKTTMRYHYLTVRMVKIQNTDNAKCWQRCGATTTPTRCWWECKNGTATLEDSFLTSYKTECTAHQSHILVSIQSCWKLIFTQKPAHEVNISFIHNCQNLKTTMSFTGEWTNCGIFRQQNII